MKAAFVTTALPPEPLGGAERYALRLAEALRARGAQVDVVGRAVREHDAPAGGGAIRLRPIAHEYFGYLASVRSWLGRHAREYEVIQFFDVNHVSAVGLAATLGSGTVRVLRDEQQLGMCAKRLGETRMPGLASASRRWLLSADVVVHATRSEDEPLVAWGFDRDRLAFVPNGIDVGGFPATPLPATRTVVCPARLRPEKNHEDLLAAFALVLSAVPDARLVLAGDGPMEATIRRRVTDLGLDGTVEVRGHVRDMAALFRDCRVCALFSEWEGPALGVLEAACAGRPAVVTAVGGLVDSVVDGVTGLHVDARRPQECAASIASLLTDDALASRLGAAAARFVREERNLDVMADRYLELMEGWSRNRAPHARVVGVR